MKVRLLAEQATVYVRPDAASAHVALLSHGQVLDVTGLTRSGWRRWALVTLPHNRRGYLPGRTKVARLREVRLREDCVTYAEPVLTATALRRYPRGSKLLFIEHIQPGWARVHDAQGNEGFALDSTMEGVPPSGVRAAQCNMLIGGLSCAGGCAITAITYAAASDGGTYVIAWGAILFGGLQFLKGVGHFLRMRRLRWTPSTMGRPRWPAHRATARPAATR